MKRLIPAALLLTILLTGCNLPSIRTEQVVSPPEQNDLYAAQTRQQAATYQPVLVQCKSPCLWAREQLEPELQAVYDLLDHAAACRSDDPVEVEATQDQVRLCLTALRTDHPEYFWFDGEGTYSTTSAPLLGDSTSVTLHYTLSLSEIDALLPKVAAYTSECLQSVAGAGSDYDKILGVYRYLINNTDYVLDVQDQSMICLMTEHRATCAGYAKSFQYLMHQLGIPCTLALGTGKGGENHGWNIVQCGGDWYQVDVTWGDPVDENGRPGSSLDYTYFMITDDEIYRDHTLDPTLPVPQCTSTTYNYYRHSGLQLSSWDSVSYEGLLRNAAARGESWLLVRFDRGEDYDAAIRALIDQGGIMTVLDNCGLSVPDSGIIYSRNDTFLEFSVQLPHSNTPH